MSRYQISWNQRVLSMQLANEAFAEAMQLLGIEFTKAITSNIWSWSDGGTRDIVNLGQLRDSQELQVLGNEAIFTWNTEYAAAVHNGAVFKSGGSMPARPWTVYVLNSYLVIETFARIYREKLGI